MSLTFPTLPPAGPAYDRASGSVIDREGAPSRLASWAWPLLLLALMAVSAGLLSAAVRSEKVPLAEEAGWQNPDGFLRLYPDRLNSHISGGLSDQRAAMFLNVSPQWRTMTGRVESQPFPAAPYMVVPLRGLVYSVGGHGARTFDPTGGSVVLACVANGRTIDLLNSPSQDWFERAVHVPRDWCPSPVKLVAHVTNPDVFVGVGTPFRVSPLYALVAGKLSFLVAFGVVSLVFLALVVPPLLATRLPYLARGAISLLGLGAFGYVSFVLQAVNVARPTVLVVTALLLAAPAALALAATALVRRRSWDADALDDLDEAGPAQLLSRMSLAWLILGAFVIVPIALLPVHSGSWAVNYAFYPVSWSTDNQLPLAMARYVMESTEVQPPALGAWSVTDRGFAPAGLIAGLLVLLDAAGLERESPITYLLAQMIVVLANASILLLLFQLPSLSRLRPATAAAVAALFCATPFFFYNVLYTWPKMASGTFALWAIMILAAARAAEHDAARRSALWAATPLFVFGVLFHSATLFLLPALVLYVTVWVVTARRSGAGLDLTRREGAAIGAGALIALGLWAYHNSFAPQSSYGLTFVLTGSGVFGLSRRDILAMLGQYYGAMTLPGYLAMKWEQLTTLVWPFSGFAEVFLYERNVLAQLRTAGFFSVLPALSLFPVAVLVLGPLRRRPPPPELRLLHAALLLSGLVLLALLVGAGYALIVHHLPYTLLLSALVWAVLAADLEARATRAVIALHIAAFLVVWPLGSWLIWSSHFSSGAP